MSKNKKKPIKENFKNTFWIIVVAYIVVIVVDYVYAINQLPIIDDEFLRSRAVGGIIASYILLPIIPILLTFDKEFCTDKKQKVIMISTSVIYYIVDFYPFFVAVKNIFL